MSDHNSEAVLVAVAAILIWLGIHADLPQRFSIRKLFIWTTIIAVVLGTIAVLARIEP
jgi:predicted secreted protein